MKRFLNKICIVTGGSRGIGKAVVEILLKQGARVFVLARTSQDIHGLQKIYTDKLLYVKCDLNKKLEIDNAFKNILSNTSRIDVLINNAGTSENVSFNQLTLAQWEEVINVNLTAVMLCCKLSADYLKKGSSIINVSSIRAEIPGTSVAYTASKAGVVGLTKALSKYFAQKGVRVNCVLPGPTNTQMSTFWSEEKKKELIDRTKLKRMASPEEVARVIVFLASDEASFVTGECFRVDGGFE